MVLKIERFQPEGSESATNPSQETASSSGSGAPWQGAQNRAENSHQAGATTREDAA
jgi:hypothetical protein